MKTLRLAVAAAAALLAVTAIAGEENEIAIAIAVDGESPTHFSSSNLGFELDELQIGETRSIVDDDGRAVLITRNETGFDINVDGKSIELPDIHAGHGDMTSMAMMSDGGEFHVITESDETHAYSSDDVMIISGNELDTSTQDSIRSVLQSAGHAGDVRFMDRASHHGTSEDHQVRIIKKQVEISE